MKKKGFTLVELLAVIIILGILLLITIPSVTSFIKESRDQSYVTTLNDYIKAARELVDTDKISVKNTNTTYYIPRTCLNVDKGDTSPYGDWDSLYVAVKYDGTKHEYFISANDESKHGVELCKETEIKIDNIRNNIEEVDTTKLIDGTDTLYILKSNCKTYSVTTQEDRYDDEHDLDAVFAYGDTVNVKMKRLAGNENPTAYTTDEKIKHIVFSETEPTAENKTSEHVVSDYNSPLPIYMWFEESTGTIYWWSEDRRPAFNTYAGNFFRELHSLISLETLRKFDSSKVTDMFCMFIGCTSLTELDLSRFDTSSAVNMRGLFASCIKLRSLDVSNMDTSNVTIMGGMFGNLTSITTLDLSTFNTSKVTDMKEMFQGSINLKSVDLSSFDTSNVKDMQYMFSNCYSIDNLILTNFRTPKLTDMGAMFHGCKSLTKVDITSFDTSKVTQMALLFVRCESLKTVDLSHLDASNATSFYGFFEECYSLELVNMNSVNSPNVVDAHMMFYKCTSLKNVEIDKLDVSKVTNFAYAFSQCKSLTTLNLSNWVTTSATSFTSMFSNCDLLVNLDISKFSGKNLSSMYGMFYECKSIITIDLSSIILEKDVNMGVAFAYCNQLVTIYVNENFDIAHVLSNTGRPFEQSPKIVGGMGTANTYGYGYDTNYAKIDGGPSDPGLFSVKSA